MNIKKFSKQKETPFNQNQFLTCYLQTEIFSVFLKKLLIRCFITLKTSGPKVCHPRSRGVNTGLLSF